MKLADVHAGTYIECGVEHNDKDPKFNVFHHVRISKYKTTFAKGYTLNWYGKSLWSRKHKKMYHWHIALPLI